MTAFSFLTRDKMSMRVLYFAWLRERLGKSGEELTLPPEVETPRAMVSWLCTMDSTYQKAFADLSLIRCAIDQEFCSLDSKLAGATEVAFFPPVTGG